VTGSLQFSISVAPSDAGTRLDVVVATHVPSCSRAYASSLITEGKIQVHGISKKPGYRVKADDVFSIYIPPPRPIASLPEPMDIDICYEDGHLIVVNKPPGLVVHPAPGHYTGTLVNGLLHHCPDLKGIGGEIRPGIVHRLDKDTSGVLVVAKNASTLNHLAEQFKSRTIRKTYLAVVHGEMDGEQGHIALPIGRHPVARKRMAVMENSHRHRRGAGKSREAETRWVVRERLTNATWLELHPKTGRTHQIRVHCAAMGHPIVGDALYGRSRMGKGSASSKEAIRHLRSVQRQMLHAWKLRFVHPVSGKTITFKAPIPDDMRALTDRLKNPEADPT
jgi:23S rRNA pseudouridine1911/1915/1917 synthase